MKKYEYVYIEKGPWYPEYKNLPHRQIIEKKKKNGYSYIGYIPRDDGLHSLDLIFEIEVEEDF